MRRLKPVAMVSILILGAWTLMALGLLGGLL